MALICDTSGLFALYDTSNVDHGATAAVVEEEPGELLVPVLLLVEIDYLLHSRLGADAAPIFSPSKAASSTWFRFSPWMSFAVGNC